ncbi:PPE family protein [Mycobacterium szulgai]|uniref:PPE family protein n=1 Tax=Mycobacterium szulgai TaxID=1787 RepID=A0A1X2EDF1_MYCSZ|nr:PPE family protein [Mycobacterium szulgai]ORW98424.1 hypothetical protein AWC27_03235 [Mycobacterium szulgai]
MFIDFALYPPEVNSARMYSGCGSGPLRAAAMSWHDVSTELLTAADSYRSVVSTLTDIHWTGPSSAIMAASVRPYVEWLDKTAASARQTALQAAAAAAAFERAFATIVPPATIAANRAQLRALIAENFFGQNTAAIAATEFAYSEMWTTDATVMYDYAITSSSARQLTPFSSPQQTTNPAGQSAQHSAVAHAVVSVGDDAGNIIGNLLIELGTLLLPIAPELSAILIPLGEGINAFASYFPGLVADDFTVLDALLAFYATIGSVNNLSSTITDTMGVQSSLGLLPNLGEAASAPNELLAPLNTIARSLGASEAVSEVSAAFRSAGYVGQLSVPPAWATVPKITTAEAIHATPMTTLPTADPGMSGAPGMPGMPTGVAMRGGMVPRYGHTPRVMSRPLAGG